MIEKIKKEIAIVDAKINEYTKNVGNWTSKEIILSTQQGLSSPTYNYLVGIKKGLQRALDIILEEVKQ